MQINKDLVISGTNMTLGDTAYKDIYSTTETKTNKVWIDGKPIYRKVIDFGNLPNNGAKIIKHGIEGIDEFVVINAIGKSAPGQFYSIPHVGNPLIFSNATVTIRISATELTMVTTLDMSSHTAKVTLEYTKTTD